jgi:fucose 4-O-acetylase-like acetyltransferase
MIWWLALLPIIKKIPYSFAISVAIALCAGLMPWAGYTMSISRTLVFLPFFVAGALYGKQVRSLLALRSQWRPLALLAVPAMAFALHQYGVRNTWFYGSFRFDLLETDALPGILMRGGLIFAAAIAAASVFAAMPSVKTIVSKAGRHSLSVFVLHGIFVVTAGQSIGEVAKQFGPWIGLGVLLIIATLVVAILSVSYLDNVIRRGATAIFEFSVRSAKSLMLRSRG